MSTEHQMPKSSILPLETSYVGFVKSIVSMWTVCRNCAKYFDLALPFTFRNVLRRICEIHCFYVKCLSQFRQIFRPGTTLYLSQLLHFHTTHTRYVHHTILFRFEITELSAHMASLLVPAAGTYGSTILRSLERIIYGLTFCNIPSYWTREVFFGYRINW